MNAITYSQPAIALTVLKRRREICATFMPKVAIANLPILLLTRADGSKGLDLTASMIDSWLSISYDVRPFCVQIGGSKGLVARTHPPACYERVDLFVPDISARLLNLITINRNAHPILVMVDPNFMPKLLDLLDDFATLGLDLNFRALVLVAATSQNPNSVSLLRKHIKAFRAMIDPPWTEDFPRDVLRIPRLPEAFIENLLEHDLTIHDGENQESIGAILSTTKQTIEFAKQLGVIYG